MDYGQYDAAIARQNLLMCNIRGTGKPQLWYGNGHRDFSVLWIQEERDQVQVNGKLRGTVEVSKDVDQETAEAAGRQLGPVARQLEGKELRKVVFVPGRILNFIVGK